MVAKEAQACLTPLQVFECESESIPPGTKSKARLERGAEVGVLGSPTFWGLVGAVAAAALIAGILIGRFLYS